MAEEGAARLLAPPSGRPSANAGAWREHRGQAALVGAVGRKGNATRQGDTEAAAELLEAVQAAGDAAVSDRGSAAASPVLFVEALEALANLPV